MSSTDPVRVLFVGADVDTDDGLPARLDRIADDFRVSSAAGARAAREAIADAQVDCILSRYDLEGENGISLLKTTREIDPTVPFLLVPVDGSERLASEAIAAGVTDYEPDPPEDRIEHLADRIRDAVDADDPRDAVEADGPAGGTGAGDQAGDVGDAAPPDGLDLDPALDLDVASQINLLEQIFRQVPVSLYVKDREGRHLLMSDFDESPVEAVGKTDLEIYDEELARESYEDDIHVVETGEAIRNREEYNPEVDEWVLTSKVPWYDETGEIQGLIGVTRFITEKKEYEREIERKNERLERFAGVISHDLRNPLTVAQGRLELLADETDSEHTETIGEALDRMETLIDDVLDLARQGQTIDETEPVALSRAFEQAWEHVETGAATCRVESDCRLWADGSRLVELLANLVRNAVEHGPETVTVRAGATDDGFYVADDGPGIPDDAKADVFEVGYTSDPDGTGFGLAIVTEIADAHGWEVAVADAEGGGARFEITGVDVRDPDA